MVKILFAFYLFLITASLPAQSVEERLQILEDHKVKVDSAFGWNVILPPGDTSRPKPIYEGIVISSVNSDRFIFNPVFLYKGYWTTYVNDNGTIKMASSLNGINNWTLTSSNAPYGSIICPDNIFKGSAHKWYGGTAYNYTYGSQNGLDWSATSVDWSQTVGEDRNLLYDGIYRNYVRVRPLPRTIGYQESSNFLSWTKIIEILKPNSQDLPQQQFYHMSVIKTDQGYFGLLTVYRIGNSYQDIEQTPPYQTDEHTTDLQVVYSQNGKTNWIRLNDQKNFIERRPGVKQIFGWWSVINNVAFIYTAESNRRHTMWENQNNKTGNYYYSARYRISLNDLYKYKSN